MHAEAIETLIDLEKRCDTAALTYGGVSYWPLCRQKIWAQLMQRLVLSRQNAGEAVPNTAPPTGHGPSEIAAFSVGEPQLGLLHADRAAADRAVARGALAPQALFLVRPEEYLDTVDGARFAKTVDSVLERVADRSVGKIELLGADSVAFARTIPSLYLSLPHAGQGVTFDPPHDLKGFDALARALDGTEIALQADAVRTDMGKIFYFARIFEKLLRALRPTALFQSVYYWPIGMAAVLAARRLGIVSVDIQHGRLGPHEGHYTHLTAAPPGGYDLVPDLVWCWGTQTKRDIEHAKNAACRRHGGLIGGNAWLARWRYGNEPVPAAELAKLQNCIADRKAILLSLQPLDEPLRPEIIEAMKRGPAEWLWLLRLHPLRRHTAPQIRALLANAGIANFEIDLATDLPLFSILRRADHHVTVFSSVANEAAAFDVRSGITGAEGRVAFAPQIARGVFRYTPAADDILAYARDCIAAGKAPILDDFIDTRREAADEALNAILGPARPAWTEARGQAKMAP